jgi:drug/metabolite transporter (DMT)-like permease
MPTAEAIICLNCGYNTQTRTHTTTKRTFHVTPKDIMAWRLPGIVCAVVVLLAFMLICFLWLGASRLSPDAWWAALGVKIYGSFAAGFVMWIAGTFAYKRLVVHPNPPEVEKKK